MSDRTVFELQPTAGRVLRAAAKRDRLAHAYLFYGAEGTGKWGAAVELAKYIMCAGALDGNHTDCPICRRIASYNHPDVHWVVPLAARDNQRAGGGNDDEPGQFSRAQDEEYQKILSAKREDCWAPLDYARRPYITMAKVRALQTVLSRTPVEGRRKVGIIINADLMRQDAQSVLLKTIEEPPRNSYLVITTTDKSALLPTILSRCQPVRFVPLPDELIVRRLVDELGVAEDRARAVAEISGGGWTRAVRLANEEWGIWQKTADSLFKTAVSGSTDDLIVAVDTVWSQRPELDKVMFCLEIWQITLCRAAIGLAAFHPADPGGTVGNVLTSIYAARTILGNTRAAVIGNVTPKIAIGSTLLRLRTMLFPHRTTFLQALEIQS